MRVSLIITLLLLTVIAGCDRHAMGVLLPPTDLGDEVRIPADIQAEYDAILALPFPHGNENAKKRLPDDIAELPLNDRRAWTQYRFASWNVEVHPQVLKLYAQPGPEGATVDAAAEVAKRIGASASFNTFYGYGPETHILTFAEEHTRAELAWYADWILVHYGSKFMQLDPDNAQSMPPVL